MPPDRAARLLALLALGTAGGAAVAGPPFLTDDPEPVELRHAEINVIGQPTRAADGRRPDSATWSSA
jgi:hypothetical protein